MADEARRRNAGAWEIVLVRPDDPVTAWCDRSLKLFLLWSAVIAVSVALYVFAGYVWGSVATVVLLVTGCCLTCCYFKSAQPPLLPVDVAVAVPVEQVVNGAGGGGGGLNQVEIEASIPVLEYHRKAAAAAAAAEQCAVCINVVRDGEAVRRLPACGHMFHAPCIDGWLRAHATCPMCRADVKLAGEMPACVHRQSGVTNV